MEDMLAWLRRPVARHDPRAVLARVEAEQTLLLQHSAEDAWTEPRTGRRRYLGKACRTCGTFDSWPCTTVRVLAWGHRHDGPGWRDEWAAAGAPA